MEFNLSTITLYAKNPHYTGQFLSLLLDLEQIEEADKISLVGIHGELKVDILPKPKGKSDKNSVVFNIQTDSLESLKGRFEFAKYRLKDLEHSQDCSKFSMDKTQAIVTDPDGRTWQFKN